MLIKRPVDIKSSEITDHALYRQRRRFIQSSIGLALAATLGHALARTVSPERQLKYKKSVITLRDELTPYEDVTTYNNFYEFGTDKSDPAKYAHQLTTSHWNFTVEGECEKPGTYHLEDILSKVALEERIYRLRCVERWSMVVPWIGFPLSDLIKRFAPTSRAKYVEFKTLHRPEEMPGQMRRVLEWPYVEGLRMDEAMHPLTIIAVGLYGEVMPNQNGAPMRLVVPWKYGYKSIKSIASIRFTEQEPVSSWTRAAAHEYGFYSNVNPDVDHPRWSQKKERRIGEFLKRDTLMFNGYGEQVASLYTGMDLKKYY